MAVVKAKLKVAGQYAKVENNASELLPSTIREFSTQLPLLIEAYYRWADLQGSFQGDSKRFLEYMDSDKTTDEIFKHIKDTFLRLFPDDTKASLRSLMKFAKDFYSKRGTEESYRFLFRAIFNEAIDIDYPANYLFETSNGVWVKRSILKCLYSDTMPSIVGRRIYSKVSNASALVKEIATTAVGYDLVAELVISDIVGNFIMDEIVESRDSGPKVISRTFGSVGTYTINSPGAGYAEGFIIPLSSTGDGSGFSAKIGAVGGIGEILSVDIISSGSGYVYEAPVLNMSSPVLFDPVFTIQTAADVTLNIVAQYTEAGRYSALKSATSDVFKLQDGQFYQNFSYVIRTNVPLQEFDGVVRSLVHPAGTQMFAQPNIDANPDNILNNTGSILFHLSKPAEINYDSPFSRSTRKFFDMTVLDYNEVGDFTHNAYVEYIKFLFSYGHELTSEIVETLYDIIINKTIQVPIELTNSTVVEPDLRSSTYLFEIQTDELLTLDPLLPFYGLSTKAMYSDVTILP